MRGKGDSSICFGIVNGITPAYAGKSGFLKGLLNFEKGSPPPMRGKVHVLLLSKIRQRITPAYAGKSCRNHGGA